MTRKWIATGLIGMLAFAGSSLGDAKQEVLSAARKLDDSENYSWTTRSESAGGMMGAGSDGKTQRDGLTMLTLHLRDAQATVIFRGEQGAFETAGGGWQSIAAVAEQRGAGQLIGNMVRTYRPPAEQALNLASKSEDLQQSDDGGYSGTLPPDEAKALMQRRAGRRDGAGGGGPEVKEAKATVNFWTQDGMLTKFQYHIRGTMSFQGEDREIDRTTTVEITDVGTTKIDIPEAAAALLR